MKLSYIAKWRIPTGKAHGLQIMKMCEAFVKRGLEVELVVPFRVQRKDVKYESGDAFEFYDMKKTFSIKKLLVPDLLWLASTKTNRKDAFLNHVFGLIFSLFALVYSLIKRTDIVFTRDHKIAWLLSFFKPIIYESHTFPDSKLILFFERNAFKRCRFLITMTNNLKEVYIKRGFDKKKIHVFPDGVDLNKFSVEINKEEARKKLDIKTGKKIIVGYLGRFYTKGEPKGIYETIRSEKYIEKKLRKKIVFFFVGGPIEKVVKYRKIIEKEKFDKNSFLFFDRVPYKKVPLYLKSFDICIMPFPRKIRGKLYQHYAYYMSPLKLFEYMASKRPIIATDLPSVREVLNESNAVLVEPDNPKSIAAGIERVLKNKKYAEKIGGKAYHDVKRYTWGNRAREIISLI